MRTAAKVVGRWLHRTVALAFQTWYEQAQAQARLHGILNRIAERWLRQDVAVAFFSWKENAGLQQRAELICQRVLRHWTQRTSAAALDSWHAHVKEQVTVCMHTPTVLLPPITLRPLAVTPTLPCSAPQTPPSHPLTVPSPPVTVFDGEAQ